MLQLNFNPFPVLETERLVLRQLRDSDAPDLFVLRSNPQLMRFIPRPIAKTIDDALDTLRLINGFIDTNEKINWAITEKGKDIVIGMIGFVNFTANNFRGEVGYMLHHDYHRQHFTSEALQTVLTFGFQKLNLHSVEGVVHPDNMASIKLLEKNGFIKEAYFRHFNFHNDQFVNAVILSKLITD